MTDRPENMHNGDCKAMFYIDKAEDVDYLNVFAKAALDRMKRS